MNAANELCLAAASAAGTRSDDPRVVRALEEYAAAIEAGNRPEREEFQARFPEIAAALAECLDGLDFVAAAAPRLAHPAAGQRPGLNRTVAFWPADVLGDYRVIREIGRGGMGVVYEVLQVSLDRRVALKVLPLASALDGKQLQRFKNEAHAAAQLHHQNIVPVYGVGCERGVHYYAMQFIDGQTLAALIGELRSLSGPDGKDPRLSANAATASLAADLVSGRWVSAAKNVKRTAEPSALENGLPRPSRAPVSLRPDENSAVGRAAGPPGQTVAITGNSTKSLVFFRSAANLMIQAANALEHAHSQGIIHRDVKPANILVDSRGNLWITDFGLAHCQNQAELTMTGDLMGTWRYMSPEQALARRVPLDHRTDIYSLGATLYELLTLEPVFDGRDRQEILRQIANEDPRRPRSLNPAIPVELETIVLKTLEKNPSDRYATAQLLADDLQRYLKDEPIHARPPTLADKTKKWMRRHSAVVRTALAMLFVLIVAVAIVATGAAWRLERERKATSDQLQLTQQAEAEAMRRLYRSLVDQARANRLSRRMGQRFESLDLLGQAATTARGIGLSEKALLEIRNEAVACLALTDLRDVGERWTFSSTARDLVAFSPQLRRQACADNLGGIFVYEGDGRPVAAIRAEPMPNSYCIDMDFSPDGRYLMASYRFPGEAEGRVRAWNLVAAQHPCLISEDGGAAAFSPDGRSLVVGKLDGSITVHFLADGESRRLEGDFHPWNMAVQPGGGQLAFAIFGGWHARLIDINNGRELANFAHDSEIHTLCFSHDGRLLAVGCDDRKVYVWDVARRRLHAVLAGHEKQIRVVAFSPRDELLATNAMDGTTRLWDPIDGRQLVVAPGELLGFCDEGRRLAFRENNRLGVWEIAHGGECQVLHHGRIGNRNPWPGDAGPESLALHRDLPLLASACGDGVRLWDTATGRELAYLCSGVTEATLFSPGGDRLYTYGRLGLQAWPIERDASGPPGALRIGPPEDIAAPGAMGAFRLAASEDGRLLAVSSHPGGHAYLLDTQRPSEALRLEGCPQTHSLAFSPDGRWIAAGVVGQGIRVWNTTTGALVKVFPGSRTFVTFSPDGRWLLGGGSNDYQMWRAGSWEPGQVFLRQHAENWSGPAALSKNNRLLALATNLQQARLRDFQSLGELTTFPAEGVAMVGALAFDAPGHRLAISGDNHTVRLWNLCAVRRALRTMQLDWEPADFKEDASPLIAAPPIRVLQFDFEAELLPFVVEGCDCVTQDMHPWGREQWRNGRQALCRGAPGGYVDFEFESGESGCYELTLYATRGPILGVFQAALDGQNLSVPIDGFHDQVVPSGPIALGTRHLESGSHRLRCTITGKNPKSGGHEMGIDSLRLTPSKR